MTSTRTMPSTWARWWRHLRCGAREVERHFPPDALAAIERAVAEGERRHGAELRFVVEGDLDPAQIFAGLTPRARAVQLFAELGVWDTEENGGVLIYVLWADHAAEIVADRGIARQVPQERWDAIVDRMTAAFRADRCAEGALQAIHEVSDLLAAHFPRREDDSNELSDAPVLL